MSPEPGSRKELLSILRQQIRDREEARDEIERSIRILRDAERELRRNPAALLSWSPDPLEETRESSPAAGEGTEASDRLEALLHRLEQLETLEREHQRQIQELLQKRESLAPERTPAPPAEDVPSPPEAPASSPPEAPAAGSSRKEKPALFSSPLEEELIEEAPPRPPTQMPRFGDAPPPAPAAGEGEESPLLIEPEEERLPPLAEGAEISFSRMTPAAETPVEPSAPATGAPREKEEEKAPPIDITDLPEKSTERLLAYIRRGGAMRCMDPWGQLCSAFVLRENGLAVFATDAFFTYFQKVFRRLYQLHQEREASEATSSDSSPQREEMESRKKFLQAFTGALAGGRTADLQAVPGLKVIESPKIPPPPRFDFERATEALMYPAVLLRFQELMGAPEEEFFREGGPYSEISQFLKAYLADAHSKGEEARAAALLGQVGLLPEAAPAPGAEPAGPPEEVADLADEEREELPPAEKPAAPDPGALSTFSASLYEESDTLQDLQDFDFGPKDAEEIRSQKENPLSASRFKEFARFPAPAAGEAPRAPEPPPAPAGETAPSGAEKPAGDLPGDDEELDQQANAPIPSLSAGTPEGPPPGAPDISDFLAPSDAERPPESPFSSSPLSQGTKSLREGENSEREIKELLKDMGVEWD